MSHDAISQTCDFRRDIIFFGQQPDIFWQPGADKIVVINEGELAEEGTHEAPLAWEHQKFSMVFWCLWNSNFWHFSNIHVGPNGDG